jgi:hypothetical protein
VHVVAVGHETENACESGSDLESVGIAMFTPLLHVPLDSVKVRALQVCVLAAEVYV